MADEQSMTTQEVVAKTLIEEHADFLREAVIPHCPRFSGVGALPPVRWGRIS